MASRVFAGLSCGPRGSGGGEPAGRYEDGSKMTSKRKPFQTQLRRSISEQLRDSTARAWDRLWKNVRERRLAGRCPRDSGARGGGRRRGSRRSRWPTAPPQLRAPTQGFRARDWAEQATHTHSPTRPERQSARRPARSARPCGCGLCLPCARADRGAGRCMRAWKPGQGALASLPGLGSAAIHPIPVE